MNSAKDLVHILENIVAGCGEKDESVVAQLNNVLTDTSAVVWDPSYDIRCLELLCLLIAQVHKASGYKLHDSYYVLVLLYTNGYCRMICPQIGSIWFRLVVSLTGSWMKSTNN